MSLYCPKCGDAMAESVEGEMQCARGRMGLARELEQRLRECYVLQTRTPRDTVFIYGGRG